MPDFDLDDIKKLDKIDLIKRNHELRAYLLDSIEKAEMIDIEKIGNILGFFIQSDDLGFLVRNDSELRSYKNLFISTNSLMAYKAEVGGLNPIASHYKSEKYNILIDSAKSFSEINDIFYISFFDYVDPKNRIDKSKYITKSTLIDEYIDKNFSADMDINSIAKGLFLNKNYMMKVYKNETGKTIGRQIMSKKIYEAKRLLTFKNISMEEISTLIGFSSSSSFSQTFKKYTGMSPNNYRKSL